MSRVKLLMCERKWDIQDVVVTLRLNGLLMLVPHPAHHLPAAGIEVLVRECHFIAQICPSKCCPGLWSCLLLNFQRRFWFFKWFFLLLMIRFFCGLFVIDVYSSSGAVVVRCQLQMVKNAEGSLYFHPCISQSLQSTLLKSWVFLSDDQKWVFSPTAPL